MCELIFICDSIQLTLAFVLNRSYEYGPCIGMTRLERWERAHALGLNPPTEVSCKAFRITAILNVNLGPRHLDDETRKG